jgi:uncharacterized protein
LAHVVVGEPVSTPGSSPGAGFAGTCARRQPAGERSWTLSLIAAGACRSSRLLAHARKQADQRNLDDVLIADVDSHHYENECYDEFLPVIENEVLRQLVLAGRTKGRQTLMPTQVSFQDMGGRITRYPMRSTEKTAGGKLRDVELGHRWMDAMSVDYACLFPTMLLAIGLHPSTEMEIELCWAYNRWLTEKALQEADGRFYSMLCTCRS